MVLMPDDPRQIFFTSRAEMVAGEELVCTVDEVVNRLELAPLYACWSEKGRGFFDPSMMLKILFFAYCDGERHSRQIAKKIRYDVRYQYFAGRRRPTYRTICRFRVIDVELLAWYFARIVSICEQLGLVDTSLVAIDGTKIRASASRQRTFRREDLDRLAHKYQELLTEDAAFDSEDVDGDDEELEKSQEEALSDKGLKEQIAKAMEQLEAGASEVNLTDCDARLMKDCQGRFQPSYNGQIAVDKNQIIVAAATGNNSDDSANFTPMVKQSQDNVGSEIGKVLVDGGYYSKRNLKYAIEGGLDLYMPTGKGSSVPVGKFGREDFLYDPSSDSYLCPTGEKLRYKCRRTRGGVESRLYRCSAAACTVCSLRSRCTTAPARELNISAVWHHEREMKEKLRSAKGRAVYSQRKVMVEPVFGNMKFNMGFAGFVLRGLKKVKGEFLLMCIAHNLKKISPCWRQLEPAEGSRKALPVGRHLLLCVFWRLLRKLLSLGANPNPKLEYA